MRNTKKVMAVMLAASMAMSGATAVAAADMVSDGNYEFISEPSETENDLFSGGENVTSVAPSSMVAPLAANPGVFNFVGENSDIVKEEEKPTGVATWLTESQLKDQDGFKDNGNLGNWDWKYNNPKGLNVGDNTDFRMWKLQATNNATYAYVWFYDDVNQGYEPYKLTITDDKKGEGADCFFVVMPATYRLVGGYAEYSGEAGGSLNATYQGHHRPGVQYGDVVVNADVDAYAIETTPYENYKYDVQDFYTQDVYDLYTQDVYDLYKYDVQDIYGHYAQKYLVPTFVKKVAADFNGTMVTRLDYEEIAGKKGSTFKATNGGAFNNGHTYVKINAEAAKAEGGLQFQIADSSKDNGKKNPLKNEYNRPIAPGSEDQKYFYNVKIVNDKLIVSVADGVDWASIGAEAWTTAPPKFNNAPKHYSKSVTLDVPKLDKDGNFALYVHLDKLGWYDRDENGEVVYQFKEWVYDDARTEYGGYEFFETVTGEPYFVETVAEDPVFVKTVNKGDKVFKKTVTGESYLVDSYETTREIPVDLSKANVTLTLKVDGNDAELNEALTLEAGNHVFVLYVNGNEEQRTNVLVEAGKQTNVTFDTVKFHVAEEDDTLATEITTTMNKLEDVIEPNKLEDVIEPNKLDDVTEENRLEDKYNEEYTYKEDIKLGNETDYNGEYAVKLD